MNRWFNYEYSIAECVEWCQNTLGREKVAIIYELSCNRVGRTECDRLNKSTQSGLAESEDVRYTTPNVSPFGL